MTTLKLAVIPGDDIGKEAVPEGLKVSGVVLEGSGITLETMSFGLNADRWHRTDDTLTEDDLEATKTHGAILLGAVGDLSVPSGVLKRGLLLKLHFAPDHYVNLHPSKHYEGVPSPLMTPEGINFIIVREGTGGFYCGNGGAARVGILQEIATEVSVNTAFGAERLVRFAFEGANIRPARHLTPVHKHSALVSAGYLWRHTVEVLGAGYPEAHIDYCHIDAATIYMANDLQRFDVIATDNLFGDILTDEARAVTGGVGLSASDNTNPKGTFPSMFEPVHGSTPGTTGQGKADPTATIASVALLLDRTERADFTTEIEAATESDMAVRAYTAATGVPLERSASQIGDALVAALN